MMEDIFIRKEKEEKTVKWMLKCSNDKIKKLEYFAKEE
jgi:hypothetical protein